MRRVIWVALNAAVMVSIANAQSMSVPGEQKVHDTRHPGLMDSSSGSPGKCFFVDRNAQGVPIDGQREGCPPPPPAKLCLIGEQRCSNPSNPAGHMVPL